MNNPCRYCEERKPGCHASCDKYATFLEANATRRARIIEARKRDANPHSAELLRKGKMR